jgi:outer membrane biosynthesis protein TonB
MKILFLVVVVWGKIVFGQEREVYVASHPVIEADLFVDGRFIAKTPCQIKLTPGRHRLRAEKKGWCGEPREVVIEEGEDPIFLNIPLRMVVIPKPLIPKPEPLISKPKPLISKPAIPKPKPVAKKQVKPSKPKIEVKKPKELPKEEIVVKKPSREEAVVVVETKPILEERLKILHFLQKLYHIIEIAEDAGAERFARNKIEEAKRLAEEAEEELSEEKAKEGLRIAEDAIREAREREAHYRSSYLGIITNFGK